MIRKLATFTVVAFLLAPAVSQAQVILGARLGYAYAGGDAGGTLGMSDWTQTQVPLQLEALFKVSPRVALGPYFSYGWAQVSGNTKSTFCGGGLDCSASVMRLGLELTYTLKNPGPIVPWLGVGTGYEWSNLHFEGSGVSGDLKLRGWELLNLQGGVDFKVAPMFHLGPYAQLSVAQYSDAEATGDGGGGGEISDKKYHQWFQLGVRGSFDL